MGDQEASKLTDSIKANTYTKLLLPTGDRKQFEAIAGSLHLSNRQKSAAQQLNVGEAVLQTGNSDSVRVDLYEFELEKEVTDANLQQMQGRYWTELSSTSRQRPSGFEDLVDVQNRSDEVISDPDQTFSLSEEAEQLLRDVVEYPFVGLTERYDQFSSPHIGYDGKTELVDNGVVEEKLVQTRPKSSKLLELTERGYSYVEDNLECEPEQKGRGGIVHRYWQHQVKNAFEDAGWPAKLELFDADVYVNTGELEIVVEIAMENTSREREHIENHLETGFDAIWVVRQNQDVRDGLEDRISEAGLDTQSVVFRETRDFEEN